MFAPPMVRKWSPLGALLLLLSLLVAPAAQARGTGTYSNPLPVTSPYGPVETCADPSVIQGQTPGDNYWYMYCTTDPLNSDDRVAGGGFNFRLIPMFRSLDLVNWEYVDDAFDRPGPDAETERLMPDWAEPTAGLWAPEIDYFNGLYYLYYGVTDVKPEISGEPEDCHFDNAIGVATSTSPTGPWVDSGEPVVYPRRGGGGCNFFWTYDPEVIETPEGQKYIYYGSYYGGIWVQELSEDGLEVVGEPVQVTIANRYEGAEVAYRNGYYYLFVSATNCCVGERTGYAVFVGRSTSPTGPFVDQQGVSLLAGRVGGTPFLIQNGNEWVGAGHNTVFQDLSGQWWTIYHAIDRFDPYLEGTADFTKRPVLLDAIDWIDGWPTVNGGLGISDTPQHAPAAQPGEKSNHKPRQVRQDEPGRLIASSSDEFNDGMIGSQWTWVRQPDPAVYGEGGGVFRFDTQAADLYQDNNSASVLTADLPNGNYVVETKLKLNLPPEGCCFNYVQAGLVIYGDDNNYIKLTHVSIWETRQTEFAKEFVDPVRGPLYGNTVGGAPGEWTWLRIVVRNVAGEEHYTAYTSTDGVNWVKGGTWTHNLGNDARIGLVSMGGSGFTAEFDYVRVYRLHR